MSLADCPERIRLIEAYSHALATHKAAADLAWAAIELHLATHRCLDHDWTPRGSGEILAMAAAGAPDIILVVDDERRFIAVNAAASEMLGLPAEQIVGKRIEDLFSEAGGHEIPAAWEHFIVDGVQSGICELTGASPARRFDYRARASFAPGLHLSVLRER